MRAHIRVDGFFPHHIVHVWINMQSNAAEQVEFSNFTDQARSGPAWSAVINYASFVALLILFAIRVVFIHARRVETSHAVFGAPKCSSRRETFSTKLAVAAASCCHHFSWGK